MKIARKFLLIMSTLLIIQGMSACKHEHIWEVAHKVKETCTTDGSITYICLKCDEIKKEEVKATGHTEVVDEAIEATCCEFGLTEGSHCSKCGTTLVLQSKTELKEHTYVDRICTSCGDNNYYTEGLVFSVSSTTKNYYVSGYSGTETDVIIPNTYKGVPVTEIGVYAFQNCENLVSISLPSSLNTLGNYAFYNCENLVSISLPGSLKTIGDHAFSDCENLVSISLPGSLNTIGKYAFSHCKKLSNIEISDSVKTIGVYAFSGCESLKEIKLPQSLEKISNGMFRSSKIEKIVIPEGVTSIGEFAFCLCTSLKTIIIPKSVVSIDKYAFELVSSIDDMKNARTILYYKGSEAEWESISIAETGNERLDIIPKGFNYTEENDN